MECGTTTDRRSVWDYKSYRECGISTDRESVVLEQMGGLWGYKGCKECRITTGTRSVEFTRITTDIGSVGLQQRDGAVLE